MTTNLQEIFIRALRNCAPRRLLSQMFSAQEHSGQWDLVCLGKAASEMALACDQHFGVRIRRALVVQRDPSPIQLPVRYHRMLAEHPIPGSASLLAGEKLVAWLREPASSQLIVMLSGGTSSLVVCPAPPLHLEHLREVNARLLTSGLPIEDINIVRKHLSLVKGGQAGKLASQHYQQIQQFVLVDICAPQIQEPELLSLVGSGPFVADPSSVAKASEILSLLESLAPRVRKAALAALRETPRDLDISSSVVASHQLLADEARRLISPDEISHPDWEPIFLTEVKELALKIGKIARELEDTSQRGVLVASGEPLVRIEHPNPGRGGRCQELALRVAREIDGLRSVEFLAAASDGSDGPTQAAGALVNGSTWKALCKLKGEQQAQEFIKGHDSSSALEALNCSIHTGSTGQNINDLFLLGAGLRQN